MFLGLNESSRGTHQMALTPIETQMHRTDRTESLLFDAVISHLFPNGKVIFTRGLNSDYIVRHLIELH